MKRKKKQKQKQEDKQAPKEVTQQPKSKKVEVAVGIDFGTRYIRVAVLENDQIKLVPNDQGHRATPTIVSFLDEDCVIGESARNLNIANPKNTVYDIKELLGKRFKTSEELVEKTKHYPFKVVAHKIDEDVFIPKVSVMYKGSEREYGIEEICGLILKKMKKHTQDFLGGKKVRHAVFTVPVDFTQEERDALAQAAKLAGMEVIQFLHEPTATALDYKLDQEMGTRRTLIFDFGGSCLNVALLLIRNGLIELVAHDRDTIGGREIDERIVNFCLWEIKNKFKMDLAAMGLVKSIRRLRNEAEKAKITLSVGQTAPMDFDALFEGIDYHTKLMRARFENEIGDLLYKCIGVVDNVLKKAGVDKSQIDDIVLSGGSSKIPRIQQLLQQHFNKNLLDSHTVEECVCSGAAIQASYFIGEDVSKVKHVKEVPFLQKSIGLATFDGKFVPIIPKDTVLPITKTTIFSTSEDNQSTVFINLFEGEEEFAKDNKSIAKFVIEGIKPQKAGEPKIEVTFTVHTNGSLEVLARDPNDENVKKTIKIQSTK